MTGQSEFPKVYAHFGTNDLLAVFEQGPSRIRKAIKGLKEKELASRPRGENKWSIIEVVMHLSDSELVGSVRFRMVLAQPGLNLPFYDQDQWTKNLGHQFASIKDMEESLSLFESLRATSTGIFRGLNEQAWIKTGVHADFGSITLRNLLELYSDHSERHLEQIREMRTLLHKPIEVSSMLKERLY